MTEEEIITDVGTVLKVIDAINAKFPEVMKKVDPYSPHRDPVNYYLTGSCVQYAIILHDIFEGYANYCRTKSHAFVKIKDHYYDVGGVYTDAQFKRVDVDEFPPEEEMYFEMATLDLGRFDKNTDSLLDDEFIKIGKETLGKIIEQKLQTKNTLS